MNWRKYIGIGFLIGGCALYALVFMVGVEQSNICQVCGESIRSVTQRGAQLFIAAMVGTWGGAYLFLTSLWRARETNSI